MHYRGNLLNNQFDSYKPKMDNVAIYWSGTYDEIENSKFTSCEAFEVGGSSDGAVMMMGSYSTIKNSIFGSNIGQNGGGLCAYDQSPYLDNLAFTNNHATSKGGGLYVDGSICDIWNCRFINNSAEGHGGGAYFDSYVQILRYLTFINNSVALGDGLVFKSWNGDFLSNSEFYDSLASYCGGALLNKEKPVYL